MDSSVGRWAVDGLDLWFQSWLEGFVLAGALGGLAILVALAVGGAAEVTTIRRRFWCPLAGREVETEFEARGLLRRIRSLKSCTAFEPGTGIACSRRCLDARYRRQWQSPLAPVPGDHRAARG